MQFSVYPFVAHGSCVIHLVVCSKSDIVIHYYKLGPGVVVVEQVAFFSICIICRAATFRGLALATTHNWQGPIEDPAT